MNFVSFGRSGNRLIQFRQVHEVLSKCSGVAATRAGINKDPAVFFPPMLIAPAATMIDGLLSYKALETAARICREVNYTFNKIDDVISHCHGPASGYRVQQAWWIKNSSTGLEQPDLLPQVVVEKRAWEHTFDSSTMVMYFRGGDILRADRYHGYSQAPCSLFLESWNLIAPNHVMLVYDQHDVINPCVQVVEQHIPAHRRIQPPCEGVGCHMSLLGRAPYVVVSGVSTFADNAFLLFPETKRVVFKYFCDKKPQIIGDSLDICVNGSTHGLTPWNYTDTTRKQMLDIGSSVVLGGFNASYVKEWGHLHHTMIEATTAVNPNVTGRLSLTGASAADGSLVN
jgi:hypothetical protein